MGKPAGIGRAGWIYRRHGSLGPALHFLCPTIGKERWSIVKYVISITMTWEIQSVLLILNENIISLNF